MLVLICSPFFSLGKRRELQWTPSWIIVIRQVPFSWTGRKHESGRKQQILWIKSENFTFKWYMHSTMFEALFHLFLCKLRAVYAHIMQMLVPKTFLVNYISFKIIRQDHAVMSECLPWKWKNEDVHLV